MKTKVIHISGSSHSSEVKHLDKDLMWGFTNDWYAFEAFNLKKNSSAFEIECWTPEIKYKKESVFFENNIKFRIFPSLFFIRHGMEISTKLINALKKEIKESAINKTSLIIHFHEYHTWQLYLTLLTINKQDNVRIIAQHHGARNPLKNLFKFKKLVILFPIIFLLQIFEIISLRKVDLFYALSYEEINYLKKICPHSKIRFRTMGIEDLYFKKIDKIKSRKELKLNKKERYFIYIGRIKKNKGIRELLEAAKITNINLLLIGDGKDFDEFKEYVKKNNMTNVNFLGSIYNNDKKLIYLSASDYMILPSYSEGAPVVIMEAIAANIPVIVTDVGGVKNMIKNNREGIIIKSKSVDDIVRAIKEVLRWKNKSIKKYAEKYRWKKIIDETIKDYTKLK